MSTIHLTSNRNINRFDLWYPFVRKERKKERNGQRNINQKGGETKERTTSTNSAPFEKFTVAHLVNIFVALCGTLNVIILLTTASHWPLTQTTLMQSQSSHPIFFNIHFILILPSKPTFCKSYPSSCPRNILYTFLSSSYEPHIRKESKRQRQRDRKESLQQEEETKFSRC